MSSFEQYRTNIFINWKYFFRSMNNRREFILTFFLLAAILFTLTKFLLFVEKREGVVLPDPLLNLFSPIDLTWLTFFLIYGALVVFIIGIIQVPVRLVEGLQLYSMMVIIRMICMFLVPLEPPLKHLPLNDPFVEFFGTGKLMTKDLFFSGHTATLLILFLMSEKGKIKSILLASTLIVAISLILQHVHYSIDIVAAVFFTFGSFYLLKWLRKRKNYPDIAK